MGVTTVYRIGRGEANDIVIDDPSISRDHAELRRKGRREFTLIDLNSTNGTCVRADSKWVEIESATVEGDERVLIGEVVTTVDSLLASSQTDPEPQEKHGLFGLKLPSRMPRTEPDAPTTDRPRERARQGSGERTKQQRSDWERRAQRLTDADVAELVGPYRASHLSAHPSANQSANMSAQDKPFADPGWDDDSLAAEGDSREPEFAPRRVVAQDARRRESTQDAPRREITQDAPRREITQDAPRRVSAHEVTEPRGPAVPTRSGHTPERSWKSARREPIAHKSSHQSPHESSHGSSPASSPIRDQDVDVASIVVDRRGSFRASPPKPDWTPPRDNRLRGRGISKWAAIGLGSIFLISAAAAGIVVYTTAPEDKASGRKPVDIPAIFARALTLRKPVARKTQLTSPAIKPVAVPVSLIRKEETRTIGAMNKAGAKFWSRTYGGKGQRRLMAIGAARGGGAFAAGSVRDPATGDHNAWLMRLDSYGNIIWQKKMGGAADDHALTLRSTRDGGVVAGGSADGGNSIWIARFDKVGEQLWQRTIATTNGGHATAIIRLGKGFAVSAIDRTQGGVRSLLIRLKSNGDVAWQRRIGDTYTWVSDLARAGRRGLLLVGVARTAPGKLRTLWVMRTDAKGLKRWQKHYPRTEGVASSAFVRRARRRTFIIATTLETKAGAGSPPAAAGARVLRIKGNGELVWDHLINPTQPGRGASQDANRVASRVAGMALQRGGVVLAGSTIAAAGKRRDLWVARLNVNGTIDWQRRYGSDRHDGAAALAQGRRGVLFVAGATTAASGQGWILKLDPRGRLSPSN